ncbi:MAG: PD-(D/E)XK nuclease family protein, partial [Acidimicrobiales bacterium]
GADRAVPLEPTAGRIAPPAPRAAGPLIDRATWARERDRALHHAARRRVIAATTLAREAADATDPGLDKRSRDLELPPWNKGRYGTAVGRAVHGVLQVIDLATGDGIEHAAAAQAVAEGVASRRDIIEALARSALTTEVARSAAGSRHWRELWVAAPVGDRLVEGYIDLLYLQGDELVVVDWKTDHLDDDHDVTAKLARYRLQGASYAAAVTAACDRRVARVVFAFLAPAGAVEAELPDLDEAIAEVRARASEGGFDDLVMAGDADTDR